MEGTGPERWPPSPPLAQPKMDIHEQLPCPARGRRRDLPVAGWEGHPRSVPLFESTAPTSGLPTGERWAPLGTRPHVSGIARPIPRVTLPPSQSSRNMADVPGFISPRTSLTKSSPIPAEVKPMAVPAPPIMAPTVAPTSGTPSTRPAMKPTAEKPRRLDAAGNCSRLSVTSAGSAISASRPSGFSKVLCAMDSSWETPGLVQAV
jgi:hypothetical protein